MLQGENSHMLTRPRIIEHKRLNSNFFIFKSLQTLCKNLDKSKICVFFSFDAVLNPVLWWLTSAMHKTNVQCIKNVYNATKLFTIQNKINRYKLKVFMMQN